MRKSSKYRPWHAGKNREAQAVRNANCTCWNLCQKKGWYGMSNHNGDCSNIGTKRNENRKRNTLRFQRKSDTDVSLFFIFIYKQFGTY